MYKPDSAYTTKLLHGREHSQIYTLIAHPHSFSSWKIGSVPGSVHPIEVVNGDECFCLGSFWHLRDLYALTGEREKDRSSFRVTGLNNVSLSTNLWAVKQMVNISLSVEGFREHGTELPFHYSCSDHWSRKLEARPHGCGYVYIPVCVCLSVLGGCVDQCCMKSAFQAFFVNFIIY